jgi:hypothetical protein
VTASTFQRWNDSTPHFIHLVPSLKENTCQAGPAKKLGERTLLVGTLLNERLRGRYAIKRYLRKHDRRDSRRSIERWRQARGRQLLGIMTPRGGVSQVCNAIHRAFIESLGTAK